MPGLDEILAVGPSLHARELLPVASLVAQPVGAQPAKQHIVGRRVFRMQLEARPLEPLYPNWPALDPLALLRGNWKAEHTQPAVLLPVFMEAAGDAVARLAEAAAVALSLRRITRAERQQESKREQANEHMIRATAHTDLLR